MLDECAPGHSRIPTDHHYCARYKGREFPTLPLGEHGKGRKSGRNEIKVGHLRQLVRQLVIDPECARRVVPRLKH